MNGGSNHLASTVLVVGISPLQVIIGSSASPLSSLATHSSSSTLSSFAYLGINNSNSSRGKEF
jgi:hypothetical protein